MLEILVNKTIKKLTNLFLFAFTAAIAEEAAEVAMGTVEDMVNTRLQDKPKKSKSRKKTKGKGRKK